jgi:uncharacterized protein YbaR (Trm112 family)
MFIELVDALRCPRGHEESWLVLGADRMDGRDVVEGVLGCPVCRAQYRISNGVADLRAEARPPAPAAPPPAADPEQALRLAALLDLGDAGGYAVLVGDWTAYADGVRAVAETHLLLVNPRPGAPIGGGTSGLLARGGLPLAPASARALAVDAASDADFLAAALAAVRPGGRVVAPAGLPLPAGVIELARDEALWVAERDAAPGGLVPLARARR